MGQIPRSTERISSCYQYFIVGFMSLLTILLSYIFIFILTCTLLVTRILS